MKIRIISSFKF